MDDLQGVSTTQQDVNVDPEYANWDETVPEARVSGLTITPFGYYLVQPFKAALRPIKEGRTPTGRMAVRIRGGLTEAIDSAVFDDLYLGVSTETYSDEIGPNGRNVKRPKTAEELAKSTKYFQHTLNRLAAALGLTLKRPVGKNEGAFEAYLSQFDGDDLPLFIVEIAVEQRDGRAPQNRIKWDTARNPNEPALDKKLKAAGKTALDEATLRAEERNKVTAQQQKAAPASAGALD